MVSKFDQPGCWIHIIHGSSIASVVDVTDFDLNDIMPNTLTCHCTLHTIGRYCILKYVCTLGIIYNNDHH